MTPCPFRSIEIKPKFLRQIVKFGGSVCQIRNQVRSMIKKSVVEKLQRVVFNELAATTKQTK